MKVFKPAFYTRGGSADRTDKTDKSPPSHDALPSSVGFGGSVGGGGSCGEWNSRQIWQRIQAAEPVRIWSTVLGTWVYWVRDDSTKSAVEAREAESIVFTLGEIEALLLQKCAARELRAIHEVKKAFVGASIVKTREGKAS